MGEVIDVEVDFSVDVFQVEVNVFGEEGWKLEEGLETGKEVEGVAGVEETEEVCWGVGASGGCHDIDF